MTILESTLIALEQARKQQAKTAQSAYATFAKKLINRWGGVDLRDLQRRDVQSWIDECRGKLAPSSIRSELAFLNRVYRVALEQGEEVFPPTSRLRIPPLNNVRDRVLESSEEERLAQAMGRRDFSLVLFAIHTGMRRLEQFRLQTTDVKIWEVGRKQVEAGVAITYNGMAFIQTSKTGKGRQCPLNDIAAVIARRWIDEGGPWLFEPSLRESDRYEACKYWMASRWRPHVRELGLQGLTWHSLRHTCASRALRNGATLEDICRLLGHSSITQTERYAHWLEDRLWPAARALMLAS